MTKVNIAKFKSHLSHYLARVRKGEEVIVMDRKTPIAHVTPYGEPTEKLKIIPAKGSPKIFKTLKIPPMPTPIDSLKLLQEDREDDLEDFKFK